MIKVDIVAENHAAGAAGGMRLPVHGRERGDVAEIADRPALDAAPVRLAAILDDVDAACTRFLDDADHVGGASKRVHEHDRTRFRRDAGNKLLRAHVESARLAVGNARHQAIEDDRRDCARIGDRRNDHLAVGRQIERGDGDVERRRARRHSVRIAAAHEFDEGVGIILLKGAAVTGVDLLLLIIRNHLMDLRNFRLA